MENFDFSSVRGFNYQPSAGSTSFENWLYFRPELFELELRRGKQYFPKFNTVRYWLSWAAFVRNPERFAGNFETALKIAGSLGLRVIPCLMNRWHNTHDDNDGIYLDHLIPGWGWSYEEGFYKPYFDVVIGRHKDDRRILAWDTCNEPFPYSLPWDKMGEIPRIEWEWLEAMYAYAKSLGAAQYVSFSPHGSFGPEWNGRYAAISDVFMIHTYFAREQSDAEAKKRFEQRLDDYVELAAAHKKGLVSTENCWGSLDDAWRTAEIRYVMGELAKRRIGIIPHALHHSLVADLHLPEYGPAGDPGDMRFINADGSLRKGHEAYNEF
ncbi:MAG: glycoside hydrolase family 5 protein [Treponema sp.]|jgi:hypothetical protein|nr:glycoside hydrolase family 5 protein [Treponema sp.]